MSRKIGAKYFVNNKIPVGILELTGANFDKITDAFGLDNKTGFHIGAFGAIKFNDKIALQGELPYSQQVAKFAPGEFD